jgi:hypothetical protein
MLLALCVGTFIGNVDVEIARAVPVVWTGPNISFSKQGSDDVEDPAFQDRLTSNVWLTRADSEGPFNIAPGKETGYVRFTSPAGTRWATSAMAANVGKTISATNYAQLAFTDWAPAYNGPGSQLLQHIMKPAVVHLVADDIYLNLQFTGFNSSGYMAYNRSTPAALIEPDGDYNDDGVVDAADYVLWRKTLNQPASPPGSGADGDGDGTIDPGDYSFWRLHFDEDVGGAGAESGGPIPEPTAYSLVLASCWAIRLLSRRCRSSASIASRLS